jgi:uncharacterized membrane protein
MVVSTLLTILHGYVLIEEMNTVERPKAQIKKAKPSKQSLVANSI